VEPSEVEKAVEELEIAIDRLRSLYDQYFMGIEKLEPSVPRKDVERRVYALRKEQIRNTALRFRFHMILQRYNTFQTHWQRICREIESGTYKRHMFRAERRFAESAPAKPSAHPPRLTPSPAHRDTAAELADLERDFAVAPLGDLQLDELQVATPLPPRSGPAQAGSQARPASPSSGRRTDGAGAHLPGTSAPSGGSGVPATRPAAGVPPARPAGAGAPATRPAGAGAPAARPAAAGVPAARPVAAPSPSVAQAKPLRPPEGLADERVRQLYTEYVTAKRRHNESTAAITYDSVAQTLRESSARLRQKHGRPVDFEVAIRDGKAILKPVLK
jgi:hypothetical protein